MKSFVYFHLGPSLIPLDFLPTPLTLNTPHLPTRALSAPSLLCTVCVRMLLRLLPTDKNTRKQTQLNRKGPVSSKSDSHTLEPLVLFTQLAVPTPSGSCNLGYTQLTSVCISLLLIRGGQLVLSSPLCSRSGVFPVYPWYLCALWHVVGIWQLFACMFISLYLLGIISCVICAYGFVKVSMPQ